MTVAVAFWRSLDRKLPLLIAAVLLVTVATFTASAYHLVQRVLLTAAAERLQGASAPLALSLAESARRQRTTAVETARQPALARFLTTGDDRAGARRALARSWSSGSGATVHGRLELRDAHGAVVLDSATGPAPARSAWVDRVIREGAARPGELLVAPLTRSGDSVFTTSLVAVPAPDAGGGAARDTATPAVLGYVVDMRLASGRGMQSIRELLGRDAAFLVGSPETGVWTDLAHAAPPPPAGVRAGARLVYDASPRGPGVGAATAVAGTPWLLWVEQSRAAVLAPMTSLLGRLSLLALVVVVAGTLGAWALSRRITAPIIALADAADHVAADAAPHAAADPPPRGRDEVARLTDAFARMAARVTESREELEGRVAERTARLETALRELELAHAELVKKERLAMLGQLASAVGHELRNPLGVMTNALYVIEQCVPDGPPLVREYLDLLRGQIAASERIVGDLLDTARVRAPAPEAVALGEFVDAQLHRLGATPGVAIERRIGDDVPPVRMDPTQLSQILLNLVTNAVQAMGEGGGEDGAGGRLIIEATAAEAGDRVRLAVTDTGPGMPPEVLDRIFDPLFTTKARGLGLGLWVSQSLASANGATLHAASRPGEGATFTLDMPAAVPAAAGAA
ncbi:MAG TPA: ATP-binding protein [Gemmatimonadaceae bacterium]|nr:ATP-binding protein [Gemmatimonadaceae bacterium]